MRNRFGTNRWKTSPTFDFLLELFGICQWWRNNPPVPGIFFVGLPFFVFWGGGWYLMLTLTFAPQKNHHSYLILSIAKANSYMVHFTLPCLTTSGVSGRSPWTDSLRKLLGWHSGLTSHLHVDGHLDSAKSTASCDSIAQKPQGFPIPLAQGSWSSNRTRLWSWWNHGLVTWWLGYVENFYCFEGKLAMKHMCRFSTGKYEDTRMQGSSFWDKTRSYFKKKGYVWCFQCAGCHVWTVQAAENHQPFNY